MAAYNRVTPILQRDKINPEDYKFRLPRERLARYPSVPADSAQLMVVEKSSGRIEFREFSDLPEYLEQGDVMVVNNTRVFPAHYTTVKEETGDTIHVMLLRELGERTWEILVHPPRKIRIGNTLRFSEALSGDIVDNTISSGRVIQFHTQDLTLIESLSQIGGMLLPPYLNRAPEPDDAGRLQSVFAEKIGSIAAPSAGLHFTEALVETLKAQGVRIAPVTVHLGRDHFDPVTQSTISKYTMQAEQFTIPPESGEVMNSAKQRGNNVIAVGASVARALESSQYNGQSVIPQEGWTDLFIFPPRKMTFATGMVSNFHLSQSKTMMLQSTIVPLKELQVMYNQALQAEYKFGIFGDAMLII